MKYKLVSRIAVIACVAGFSTALGGGGVIVGEFALTDVRCLQDCDLPNSVPATSWEIHNTALSREDLALSDLMVRFMLKYYGKRVSYSVDYEAGKVMFRHPRGFKVSYTVEELHRGLVNGNSPRRSVAE